MCSWFAEKRKKKILQLYVDKHIFKKFQNSVVRKPKKNIALISSRFGGPMLDFLDWVGCWL